MNPQEAVLYGGVMVVVGGLSVELRTERFQILSELGQGGMGIVYRAIDKHQGDREVALKVVRQHGAITTEQRLQFKEEFRAMARLQHPNTIQVFDYGQLDQLTQFLTMEVVSGRELSDVLRDGPTAPDHAVRLLIQLLQALDFIHSRGFVHRDVKAENVRLCEDGTLKLMDFGLISKRGIPATGKLTGTVGYLAPEVVKGGIIDASTDLYSVGCLAYLMLTGRMPFEGAVVEVLRNQIHQDPAPLRHVRHDLPERLESIVMRLLAKQQSDRYQEADDAVADLSEFAGIRVTRGHLEHKRCYLTSSALIGREAEVQRLEAGLEDARQGRQASYFVGAPAGVGKSRLVHELLLQAKLDGVTVLTGQCQESGMAPYEAVAQALKPLVALSTPDEIERFGPILCKLLPELLQRGVTAAPPLDAAQERLRLDEAIAAWLAGISGRAPLVLNLEDLHWCDPSSLEALNHCIRFAGPKRLMVLGTFRNDEVASGSPIWFTIEEGHTHHLKLGALTLPQVMQLLHAMFSPLQIGPEFAAYLHSVTGGNAYFLTEVLRYLMEEGLLFVQDGTWTFPREVSALTLPNSVDATVARRLEHLGDQARTLARVAAVIGRYQGLGMLQSVSGFSEESLFRALDELTDRQFLFKEDQRYTFPHDGVREALYASTPGDERRELHQRCAEHLESTYGGEAAQNASELAHHFSRGLDRQKAVDYLRLAGQQARAVGVVGTAVEHWQQAEALLETLEVPDKNTRLAELWWNIGSNAYVFRPATAIPALEKTIRRLESQRNSDTVGSVLRFVAGLIQRLPSRLRDRVMARIGKPVAARPSSKGSEPDSVTSWLQRLIESYGLLGAAYCYAGMPSKGLPRIERALDLLPFKGTPHEGALLVAKGAALFASGRIDEVLDIAGRAKALLFDRDLSGHQPLLHTRIGAVGYLNAHCFQGVRPDEELLAYTLNAADEIQAYGLKSLPNTFLAFWYAWTGRAEEALNVREQMVQTSRKIGAPPRGWALYIAPYVAWQRGEFEEARALLQQALGYPHLDEEIFARQSLRILQGHVALSMGEVDEARAIFASAEEQAREAGMALITMQALIGKGQLALAEQDHDGAARLLEEACRMTSGGPERNPLHQAIALRHLGDVLTAKGQLEEAERAFEQAMAIVSRPEQDNLIQQGHLRLSMGDLWRARGDLPAAERAYGQAREIFAGLRNRYHKTLATRRLEALLRPAVPQQESGELTATVRKVPVLPPATLELGHDEFLQAVLAASLDLFGAEEATLFWLEPELAWAASRNLEGPCDVLETHPTITADVRRTGHPRAIIDFPDGTEMGMGTNMEAQVSSVLVGAISKHGAGHALLYLRKRDVADPYDDPDVKLLATWCQSLSYELIKRESWIDRTPDFEVRPN